MKASTFTSGLNGWNFFSENDGELEWDPTAGVASGGGVSVQDTSPGQTFLAAPNHFVKNISKYDYFAFDAMVTKFDFPGYIVIASETTDGVGIRAKFEPSTIDAFETFTFDLTDPTKWTTVTSQPVSQATLDKVIANPTSLIITTDLADDFAHEIEFDNMRLTDDPTAPVVCFAQDTRILTEHGERLVQSLTVGTKVWTQDGGYQPIRWIEKSTVPRSQLTQNPHLRPITIAAGALGQGVPDAPLRVSPQHRILVSSPVIKSDFGVDHILIAAKRLLPWDGVTQDFDCDSVDYFHILLDDHHIICANATPTESLYTGPEAKKALSPAAWQELVALYPQLGQARKPARPILEGRASKTFATKEMEHRAAKTAP